MLLCCISKSAFSSFLFLFIGNTPRGIFGKSLSPIALIPHKLARCPFQCSLVAMRRLKASKWINITFLLSCDTMLATILRIGPLAILESILFSMALIIFYF